MAATMLDSFLLPHPTILCPPPLQFQKKPRKTTIRRRMLRRATQTQRQTVHGPLDDIIAEIKSDIRESPPEFVASPLFLDWGNPLKAPSTWAVTPLPVSRAPSNQPLTIRKNRNSRSSASGSSMGDSTSYSRNSSHDELVSNNTVGTPWPSFDGSLPHVPTKVSNISHTTSYTENAIAQRSLESAVERATSTGGTVPQRRPSRLRMFTNGFPRLRRMGTGDTNTSTVDVSESASPNTAATTPPAGSEDSYEPSDEAVNVYMKRNAHNCTRLRSMMERMATRLPTPVENEPELGEEQSLKPRTMPTTLRAAIRVFPEVKILTKDVQEFSVAIEIEGVLHNRNALSCATIDVVFVVDNGYDIKVVEKDWLTTWQPTRPNPSMTDVVLGVARSLEKEDLKHGRTHIILLSSAAYVLHDISKTLPNLAVHRINPAALPYRREPELQDTTCFDACCKNVFASNWTSYQSAPGRIKRVLKNARSMGPIGELTNVSLDLRAREGCELIEYFGRWDIPHLRLGQVHTVFARIRVYRTRTQSADLQSDNPIFNSSLDVKGLRKNLHNALALGAIKVHLFDVQLYHRNSINTVDCWNYTEAPLITTLELGRLAAPLDNSLDLYKRLYFNKFVQLKTEDAQIEAENLLAILSMDNQAARKVVEQIYQEIKCQVKIREYEQDYRQRLPLCPGPIDIESPHEWLLELWNKRKGKRNGVTVRRGTLSLADGLERLPS
ncbi:hypothetical protein SNOG_06531 [Parastagonospora nodorum SN15]|uniref:Uncharacterized protein n=1 Tax=Phaeosphaeria nodorum (strain SN15 / ATCC MYA-4574 / FGSC 10173) TaxID=321614 RepID=Q0UNY3_PHANO|nr:hypothetical protein SNOG_06531 [Parastagonospora nodorum SN15]EAT86362.2 hypothetical protein SNOG_06531 [Parastagonospora nodorum SN15]